MFYVRIPVAGTTTTGVLVRVVVLGQMPRSCCESDPLCCKFESKYSPCNCYESDNLSCCCESDIICCSCEQNTLYVVMNQILPYCCCESDTPCGGKRIWFELLLISSEIESLRKIFIVFVIMTSPRCSEMTYHSLAGTPSPSTLRTQVWVLPKVRWYSYIWQEQFVPLSYIRKTKCRKRVFIQPWNDSTH